MKLEQVRFRGLGKETTVFSRNNMQNKSIAKGRIFRLNSSRKIPTGTRQKLSHYEDMKN